MNDLVCNRSLSKIALPAIQWVWWSISLLILLACFTTAQASTKTSPEKNSYHLTILGDSLSAGYGVPSDARWVTLLHQRLDQEFADSAAITVRNASVSGDTSRNALNRLRTLSLQPGELVIIIIGGNDGLRALPPKTLQSNLAEMIDMIQRQQGTPWLMQIKMPDNYGPRYQAAFEETYQRIATQYDIPLLPFFLNEVALDPELMQSDMIHPNAKAQPILMEAIYAPVKDWLNMMSKD